MSSSAMELSILKLTSPRKRLGHSGRFSFDTDPTLQYGASNSPRGKATGGNGTSPAPWFADEDLFTIFEQHHLRAAIPFKWEASPGTCRDQKPYKNAEAFRSLKKEMTFTETVSAKDGISDSDEHDNSSVSSAAFSLSPSGSTNSTSSSSSRSSESLLDEAQNVGGEANAAKFQIQVVPIKIPSKTFTADDGSDDEGLDDSFDKISVKDGRKLVDDTAAIGKSGRLMPLKPPPGMHSIKQLLSLESEDRSITMSCFSSRSVNNLISSGTASNSSAITNLKSHQRRSFRRDGLKALPFVSSTPRHQSDDFLNTMLGMEEWSKVVKKQEKQDKHQQQEEPVVARGHHRALSMPRLALPFKKKSTDTDSSSSIDILDAETVFEDFGKKSGLRDWRPLSSVSSRSFSDVHKHSKGKNWVFDSDADYTDGETDVRDDFVGGQMIAEGEEKQQAQNLDVSVDVIQPGTKEKRKNDALNRLRRIFNVTSRTRTGDQTPISQQKPARLSSVSPAPLPLVATQSELRLKKVSQSKQVSKTVSSSPILKICSALPFGNAILKNVRQLRAFDFHTPSLLSSK